MSSAAAGGAVEVVVPQKNDLASVDLDHAKRSRADGTGVERLPRKLGIGHVPEQVRRKQRHGRAVSERPVHVGKGETHGPLGNALDADAAERVAVGTDIPAVLEQFHREYDVIRSDRLAVVPRGVVADVEGPNAAIAFGVERRGQVGNDGSGLVVSGQPAEHEARDVLIDIGSRDDGVQVLRNAGNAFHVGTAEGRVAARWILVRCDRRDARHDHEPDEGDNDELVAPGHLAGGRLPRAPERYGDEEDDEDDRQPKEGSLEPSAASVSGRLATKRGRESRTAGLQQDRGSDRDGNDDLTYLEGVHG